LAPTSAALEACDAETSYGQMSIRSFDGDQRASQETFGSHGYSNETRQAVTVDGVSGRRVMATITDATQVAGGTNGEIDIRYVFYTNGFTYLADYAQTPSGVLSANVQSDFDLMIKNTLRFLD
jgi:hypothetical protein